MQQGLYFKKDKKAQIYREAEDPRGNIGYYPIAPDPVWCYASQLAQDIQHIIAYFEARETRYFVFNYYRKVEPDDLIRYRDEWFLITRVDTKDDYNGEMFVYVETAPTGKRPRDRDLKPYNPDAWDW